MIAFDEEKRIFYLENKEMTYAFGINAAGLPEHLYFGKKVAHDLFFGNYFRQGRNHPAAYPENTENAVDPSMVPQEFHTLFSGDYSEPTLMLDFSDGSRRLDFRYQGYEILPEKPELPDFPSLRSDGKSETLAVVFSDRDVILKLFYTVYEDVNGITRFLKIENGSREPIRLERAYSFAFSLPAGEHRDIGIPDDYEAVSLSGGSGAEANISRTPLSRGIFSVQSNRGASGAGANPFLAILRKETTENSGTAYGINLVYSGSFTLKAEKTVSSLLRIQGGINDLGFSWKLRKGESFTTPETVMVYSGEGLSGMSRAFHDLYRNHLIPKKSVASPRPIVINNWEATRFLFTREKLQRIIEAAAGTGIDSFILDDGWFGKRDNKESGLGDWFVNEKKLGSSLKEFISYVHSKGMKFGLWFEPEMVSRDSDLYRAHPEWAIADPNHKPLEVRSQLMLDLSNEDVISYLTEQLDRILRENEIDIVKWDRNRDLTEFYSAGLSPERQGEFEVRQTMGFYRLAGNLTKRHPEVFFEGCASGGSRFDPGMLYYFPQIWTSDQTDAYERTFIQYGTSLCYPLSAQSCHVTESPNRRAKHFVPLKSRFDIASLGAFGFELDLSVLPEDQKAAIPLMIKTYREEEALVQKGDLYRLSDPFSGNYFSMELVSKEKDAARITVMKGQEFFNRSECRIFPKGLSEDAVYFCGELGKGLSGRTWMNFGFIPVFPQGDFLTQVYHFRKTEKKSEIE